MGEMARDFFSDNPATSGPLIAMLLFVAIFVVASIRAWRAEKTHVERIARLPLEGDTNATTGAMTEVEHHG
jgi:uncharacterized membrane protein (DUF485 family)